MKKNKINTFVVWSTILAYTLIGVEIIIMITPFAMYFYGVYGPILSILSSSPYLSWTTEFFLPHFTFPDDPFILAISYLQIFMIVGLILFFSAAIPLYYGRFTGKGVVKWGFYSKIRHPQYLFLGISGFGLLLYWPRFIILIMYITMLFVYYLLARNEEWRMKKESPVDYEEYMKKTSMFIPGEPGSIIYRIFLGWIKPKWIGLVVLYVSSLVLSVFLAIGIREYTIKILPTVNLQNIKIVSAFPRPPDELKFLYSKALESQEVRGFLGEENPSNLVYIFPADFFLTAIVTDEDRRFSQEIIERFPEVLEWHQHKFRGGLGKFFRIFYNYFRTLGTIETNYEVERFVFVMVRDELGSLVPPEEVFNLGLKRRPILLVDVDAHNYNIVSIIKTSGRHKWGDMPMPTF